MAALADERKELIQKLRNLLQYPIFLLVYKENEEVSKVEVEYIRRALEEIDESRGVIILEGDGGEIGPTIDIALFLRQRFLDRMVVIVPNKISSSLAYIILLSNEILGSSTSYLTQFDFTFTEGNRTYRAPKEINHNDPIISEIAKHLYNSSIELLEKILERPYSILKDKLPKGYVHKRNKLVEIADVCMRRNEHSDLIKLDKLKEIGFNIKELDKSDNIIKISKELVDLAKKEIEQRGKRVCIEIEDYSVFI